ncbi:hypothetical protein SAMN06309944_0562 [Micrococcales bacterium KH10]|nr:hypothetical protein SAMN06309944_0562 [Micrococcales bacterium KH10]
MTLLTYRTQARWAVAVVNSKKATAEFYDVETNKRIPRTAWTADMKAFAAEKAANVPKPPFVFRLTIIGWIVVALLAAGFGVMTYETLKPTEQSAEQVAMEQTPVVGDMYFGRFEGAAEPDSLVAISDLGFGWFKIVKVEGDTYFVAKSTDMSKQHQPKEQLESAEFEEEGTPAKIVEQTGWQLTLEAIDESVTFYVTDKK